jgi:hypothetical protein
MAITLTNLRVKAGVNLDELSPAALKRLLLLDQVLGANKIEGGIITSGKRPLAPGVTGSGHTHGNDIDVVFRGDMSAHAARLNELGFRAGFERKGQRNPNQSVATGDHIHFSLTKGSPRADTGMAAAFGAVSPPMRAAKTTGMAAAFAPAPTPAPVPTAKSTGMAAAFGATPAPRAAPKSTGMAAAFARRREPGEQAFASPAAKPSMAEQAVAAVKRGQAKQPSLLGQAWRGLSSGTNAYYAWLNELAAQGKAAKGRGEIVNPITAAAAAAKKVPGAFKGTFQGRDVKLNVLPFSLEDPGVNPWAWAAAQSATEIGGLMSDPTGLVAGPVSGLIGKGLKRAAAPVAGAIEREAARRASVELAQGEAARLAKKGAKAEGLLGRAQRSVEFAEKRAIEKKDALQAGIQAGVKGKARGTLKTQAALAEQRLAERQARVAALEKAAGRRATKAAAAEAKAAGMAAARPKGVGPAIVGTGEYLQKSPAVRGALKLGETVGVGPQAKMRSEAFRATDIAKEAAHQEAGQIGRDMRRWELDRRHKDVPFDLAEKAFGAANQGQSRMQQLVKSYVDAHTKEGFTPKAAAEWMPALQQQAAEAGIGFDQVRKFGDRIVGHAGKTAGVFKQAGGKLAELFQDEVGEEAARGRWLRGYTDNLFKKEAASGADIARTSQAFSGGGIPAVKEAYLQQQVQSLRQKGLIKEVVDGKPKPGWVQIGTDEKALGQLAGRQVPKIIFDRLSGDIARSEKVLTKAGKVVGTADLQPYQKVAAGFGRQLEKFIGVKKKHHLMSVKTWFGNAVGNTVNVGIGMERNGMRAEEAFIRLPASLKAVVQWEETGRAAGRLGAVIEELNQHSRSFLKTLGESAGASGRSAASTAGTAGRFVNVGGKRVFIPPAKEAAKAVWDAPSKGFSVTERSYKLAMYDALRSGGMSADDAARQVDKFLFDYSDRSAWMEALDKYGIAIFNVWPVKQTAIVLDTLANRPDILAKYDRLRRAMMDDEETQGDFKKLKPYQQKLGTVPIPGQKGKFTDIGRAIGITEPLDIAKSVAKGDWDQAAETFHQFVPGSDLKDIVRASDLITTVAGMRTRPIPKSEDVAHPGAPRGQQIKDLAWEAFKGSAPAFIGDIEKILAAKAGKTLTKGQFDQPKTITKAVVKSLTGLEQFRGETPSEAEKRQRPEIRARGKEVTRIAREAEKEYKDPARNPFTEKLAGESNEQELRFAFYRTREYWQKLVKSPNADERRLREAMALLLATANRWDEVAKGNK